MLNHYHCCNLSSGVALNVWFTTNGMYVKNNNIYMWRDQAIIEWSRRVISTVACCHSAKLSSHAARAFPIATKWCCDQDVKVVPGSAFTQRTCDRCGSLWKGGDVVATFPVALRWMCDSPRTGCARRTTIYMWREQAIIEWSRRVISIVACCHSAKLCAHAAQSIPIATPSTHLALSSCCSRPFHRRLISVCQQHLM